MPARPQSLLSHLLAIGLLFSGITAPAAEVPDVSKIGVEQVKKWSWQQVLAAESSFNKSGGKRMASPDFWGDRVVYQIQVDRFNNGDQNNDSLNMESHQKSGDLRAILDFRHGGDLAGITQRLNYLQDLGVTALWLTPFLKHNGSYHGYCMADPTLVDPGFGTNEDFRRLVKEAHKRGILVVMDVVINHLCDSATVYSRPANHYACADELNAKNWSGTSGGSSAQGELAFSSSFFGPLKSPYFFNRCGANSQSDMEGTGPAAIYGDFVNTMFDFDTRNQDFQEIFSNLFKFWIAYADVDGFRLDAAKHVSEDYVAHFSTQARHYARTVGKNNFFVVGEVAGPSDWIARRTGKMYSNPSNPNEHGSVPQTLTNRLWSLVSTYLSHPFFKMPGLNAAYDFAHGGAAIEVLHGSAAPKRLEEHFGSGYFRDIDAQTDSRFNWNLLEIHDWPRFASRNKGSIEKSSLGMAYLAFAQGQPVVGYGMEQGFNGDCHYHSMNLGTATDSVKKECGGHSHALFRQDMFISGMVRLGSTVPKINQLSYIGPTEYRNLGDQDPYISRDHALYQSARRFLRIRGSCKALKFGTTAFRWVEQNDQSGVLAFSRVNRVGEHTFEALVVLNTAWQKRPVPRMKVEDYSQGQRWRNLLNGYEAGWTQGQGELDFGGLEIGPNSAMVFVPDANVGAFDAYLGSHLCAQ